MGNEDGVIVVPDERHQTGTRGDVSEYHHQRAGIPGL